MCLNGCLYFTLTSSPPHAHTHTDTGQTELEHDKVRRLLAEVTSSSYSHHELHWPSDDDVMEAFSVFDQEGLGYIPVQQLKRFLLRAQLGFKDEEECE